jgi:predicted ribosome quality control (RQC) complex YloA/Tae2 family protein
MIANYYTLKAVVKEISPVLESAEILEIFSQNKNELIVSLTSENVNYSLIISIDPSKSYIYLGKYIKRAKNNSVTLFNDVVGEVISKTSIQPTDRIMEISFSENKKLVIMFFRAESNICLVENGKVITAFKRGKDIVNKDFFVEKRDFEIEKYLRSADELKRALRNIKEKNIQRVFNKVLPFLSSTIVKEIIYRAGYDYGIKAEDFTNVELDYIWNHFKQVFLELNNPTPRVYYKDEKPVEFAIIELKHLGKLDFNITSSISEGIIIFLFKKKGEKAQDKFKEEMLKKIDNELLYFNSSIEKLTNELSINRADEYQTFADIIMSNLTNIDDSKSEFYINVDNKDFVIPLNKDITPIQNATYYYEKSKKAKELITINQKRLDETLNKKDLINNIYEKMKQATSNEEFNNIFSKYKTNLENVGIAENEEKKRELTLFRRFIVDGNFEVLCGKSSENNDLLTMKHAKPEDLWFHARGASGSHVILKIGSGKGEPSKRAIHEAASIAAFYSHAKNANTVPVAMTKKKYVRKFKGAAVGAVTLQQEKVIFVTPKLPNQDNN